jgi:hypothetical protein
MNPKWNLLQRIVGTPNETPGSGADRVADRATAGKGAIRHRLGRHRGSDQQHRNRDIQHDRSGATAINGALGTC